MEGGWQVPFRCQPRSALGPSQLGEERHSHLGHGGAQEEQILSPTPEDQLGRRHEPHNPLPALAPAKKQEEGLPGRAAQSRRQGPEGSWGPVTTHPSLAVLRNDAQVSLP